MGLKASIGYGTESRISGTGTKNWPNMVISRQFLVPVPGSRDSSYDVNGGLNTMTNYMCGIISLDITDHFSSPYLYLILENSIMIPTKK